MNTINILELVIYIPLIILLILSILLLIFYKNIIILIKNHNIKKQLNKLNQDEYFILKNILLETNNNTIRLDHIVISKYGIHVIEPKRYHGYITGIEDSKTIKYNNKYDINNPIIQNNENIKILKEILNIEDNKIIGIVSLPNKTKIRINTNNIINTNNLYNKIIENKEEIINNPEDIYIKLLNLNIKDKNIIKEHKSNIKKTYKNNINIETLIINRENIKIKTIISILPISLILLILLINQLIILNSKEINKTIVNKEITSTQKETLDILKTAYNNSKQTGFELIHRSVCNELSNTLNNKLKCNYYPLEINYESNNLLTVYKDKICYKIELNNNKIESIEGIKTNINNCKGKSVGYLDWDTEDVYLERIGGFEKIREMALYSYNNDSFVTSYYDNSHIVERGGDIEEYNTYKENVDRYFASLTGKVYTVKEVYTTKEQTSIMTKSLYYILK